ncbi:MAG: DUF2853 family protein [Epsilonproteobacteria bacterium]|nr:DUF2853 family protein [Campylobacterota bacterium]
MDTFKTAFKKDAVKTAEPQKVVETATVEREAEEVIETPQATPKNAEVKEEVSKVEDKVKSEAKKTKAAPAKKEESAKVEKAEKAPAKKAVKAKEADTKPKAKKSAKTEALETTEKSAKKATAKKEAPGAKRAAKIKLYTEDVKKHYGSVDAEFLEIVVKNLGPSIYKKDAESVSCTDPKELDTVRKNFLIKKLGFTKEEKEMLNGEIAKVCETMKGTRIKYRATFYYILAKNLKKESMLS